MTFRDWMKSQDWEDKHLDKDLIGNEKLYSPENCVFISRELNMLFNDREAARGEHPLGVTKANGAKKFKAKIGGDRKRKHLGYFTNTYDAHEAWYNAKLKIVNELLAKETNPRIRYAIACKIAKLEANFLCGISRYRGSRVTKGPDYQPPEENIRNILLGEIEKEPR